MESKRMDGKNNSPHSRDSFSHYESVSHAHTHTHFLAYVRTLRWFISKWFNLTITVTAACLTLVTAIRIYVAVLCVECQYQHSNMPTITMLLCWCLAGVMFTVFTIIVQCVSHLDFIIDFLRKSRKHTYKQWKYNNMIVAQTRQTSGRKEGGIMCKIVCMCFYLIQCVHRNRKILPVLHVNI